MSELHKDATKAVRRFREVMNLKMSANTLARELAPRIPGVNYMGCSKSDMAEAVALGGDHWARITDPDGFVGAMKAKYGVKGR